MLTLPPERCPTCGTHMAYMERMDPEPRSGCQSATSAVQSATSGVTTARITVDFSAIWHCPQHGKFRIYTSGAVAPFA